MKDMAEWTKNPKETVRNKWKRLITIIPITQKNTVEKSSFRFSPNESNDQLASPVSCSVGCSFLAAHNLAGIAHFNKPPSVYPVFGSFRGTNPPLLRSLILVLTLTRLSEWKRENNGSFLCTVAQAWQENRIINGKTCHRRFVQTTAHNYRSC